MYGLYSNIGLALFKFVAGVTGNSMAMIADGVHSLSDLVTDGITLWAARLTHKPQDADHPYGHGKFEAVGSLTISVTLAVTAGGIGWQAIESIQTILSGAELAVPTGIALVAAVVSIAVKEVLYHTTLRVGTRWNSKVVKANAWHHRSDSISTLVALVGVVGAMVRVPILDPVAGLFVSGLILKAALELGWDSLRDLTDENVDARLLSSVAGVLQEMRTEGVLSFHRLRGRAMGPFVLMDVHISVEPTMSVSAAHQIAERARIRVRQKLPIISEFLVHVDVAQHSRPRTVFESLGDDDEHDRRLREAQARNPNEVHFITAEEIHDAVHEHEASRAQTLKLGAEAAAASAPAGSAQATSAASQSAAASSSSAAVTAAASSEDCHEDLPNSIDRQANPAADGTARAGDSAANADGADAVPAEAAVGAPAHMDLSRLMRPQHLIERDVQHVLSDPHSSFAPHLLGVSHFTCHWLDQQLTIQLELAFRTDLTISQAARVAEDIEATILEKIHDVNHVDIHLELTHAHIINTKQVKHPLELTPAAVATASSASATTSPSSS